MSIAFKLYSITAEGSVHTYQVYIYIQFPAHFLPSSEHEKRNEANIKSI